MQTVEFGYSIGDEVTIIALDLKARVIGLIFEGADCCYRIAFWADSSRAIEVVYPWEIR